MSFERLTICKDGFFMFKFDLRSEHKKCRGFSLVIDTDVNYVKFFIDLLCFHGMLYPVLFKFQKREPKSFDNRLAAENVASICGNVISLIPFCRLIFPLITCNLCMFVCKRDA